MHNHKILKCFSIALCFIISVSFLSGCSDINQLHERLIVQGVGVDIDSESGRYIITMHAFDAINTGPDETDKVQVITQDGLSVFDAINSVSLKNGKQVLFSQNLLLIIGENMAKHGIGEIMDFFVRYYEARPSVSVFVAKNIEAKNILNCKREDEIIPASSIEYLSKSGRYSSKMIQSDVLDIINSLESGISAPSVMALEIEEGDEGELIQSAGTAVFNNDKLVGYLDLEDTRGLLLISGNVNGGTFVVPIEGIGTATLYFDKFKSKVVPRNDNGTPNFEIYLDVDLDLYEVRNDFDKELSNESFDIIEEKAGEFLIQNCNNVLDTATKTYKADIFNFGKKLRRTDPDFFRTVEENWQEIIPLSEHKVYADVKIRREGLEMNPM